MEQPAAVQRLRDADQEAEELADVGLAPTSVAVLREPFEAFDAGQRQMRPGRPHPRAGQRWL
jgi:hypothetical protein